MNFKNKIIFALAIVLFCGCTDNKPKIIIKVADNRSDLNEQDFAVINQFGDSLAINVVKSKNEFVVEFNKLKNGYHDLIFGEENVHVYLTANTDLSINLAADEVTFSGKGAAANNYLKRKYAPEFDWYTNYYKTKQTGSMINYFRDHYIKKLKQELTQIETNPQFVQAESKELDYKYANQLLLDRIMLETNSDTDPSIIADLNKTMSTDIDDTSELNNSKNFISVVARILVAQNRVDDATLNNYYNSINHPNFKTHFLESLASALHKELQFAEDDFAKAATIESFINKQQPADSIGYPIFNLYHKFNEAAGKQADFTYEDVNGKMVSLKSLQGKYVYVDFWATWCANCIKEFPHLKKLEAQFKNDNIEFIGISIDQLKAKEKWKEMVAEKELHNLQLFSPFQGYPDKDDLDDAFITLLYVNAYYLGIPHYALIDPTGKVIDAYFYRPSNPKTAPYLSKLLSSL
ncbi:MAG: TlpA family protein disulfide reductase [Flammeovirgaceae bacterium]